METSKDSDKLLEDHPDSGSVDDDNESDINEYTQDQKRDSKRIRCKFIVATLALLLISTNLGWCWGYYYLIHNKSAKGPAELTYFLGKSEPQTSLVSFDHDWLGLEEGCDGYRYADEHWKHLEHWVPRWSGYVVVTREFQESLKLDPRAATTSDNSSDVHYLVAGYHQLHCLQAIRIALYQLRGDMPDAKPFVWDHVIHCVEAVRQALFCFLDPTLLPVGKKWPGIPNEQKHVCRNSDALLRWSNEFAHPSPDYAANSDTPYTPDNTPHTQEWLDRHGEISNKEREAQLLH